MSDQPKLWYRYDDECYDGASSIFLSTYRANRYTPKGVWLYLGYKKEKFVLVGARKRYACPTKEEAMVSFIARKKRQLAILRGQHDHIVEIIDQAEVQQHEAVAA